MGKGCAIGPLKVWGGGQNWDNIGLRSSGTELRRPHPIFWLVFLTLFVALPHCASGARLQASASVRVHSAPILSCASPSFSAILQSPVDSVAAPHHRVRRRALKSDSLRMEPVVLEIAIRRDLADGIPLSAAFESPGRSPPSL